MPDWLDCAGLLPAIDRWGYLDPYASMHPSSLSVLIQAMTALLDQPAAPLPSDEPEPRRTVRHVTAEEERRILDRADELNTRITAILKMCEQQS